MSRTDREVLEEIYERWNRNDGDLALELFDDDARIYQNPTLLDTAREFRGPAGLLESARELTDAWARIDWLPESWVEEGGWVIARLSVVGLGRTSGITLDGTVAHAWRLRAGRVTDFYVYASPSAAVRAIQAAGGTDPEPWTRPE